MTTTAPAEKVTVLSAHCTPQGRVRLRLSDGSTVRVPRSSRYAQLRKGDAYDNTTEQFWTWRPAQ